MRLRTSLGLRLDLSYPFTNLVPLFLFWVFGSFLCFFYLRRASNRDYGEGKGDPSGVWLDVCLRTTALPGGLGGSTTT